MTRFLKSEAGAVVLWLVASILLAAVISPLLFVWGKDFAIQHAGSDGLLGGLAGSCERAKFNRYFNRALMISAVFLFWPLWFRVRMLGRMRGSEVSKMSAGIGWKVGMVHCLIGCAVAAGMLWAAGVVVRVGGAFVAIEQPAAWNQFISQALIPALFASVVEEWLFRALLLGLWLRISGPWTACIGTALVFAFVHFLEPPSGVEMADPRAWSAGFELLGLILQNYLSPHFIAAEFLTLFVVGLALGWARLRTGSLWLPIGIHAGWIFAFKSFFLLHMPAEHNAMGELLVGDSLRVGLLPLATLLSTWLLLAVLLSRYSQKRNHVE